MKVILLEDVKNLGKKGDIVEANDAYARNVLIRGKKGLEATGKNLNDLKLQKANNEKIAAENLAAAQELGKKIDASSITLKVKTGEGGKLFGAISSREIADAVSSQLGLTIDKKKVQMDSAIKALGTVKVPIRLHTKVTAQLTVNVEKA